MKLFPHAKINLSLYITGRGADAYHTIDTVFLPVSLYDVLEILPGEAAGFTCSQAKLENDDNLVIRARDLLQRERELPPASIHLTKYIPDQAGLGGGSADAAMTLWGLSRLGAPDMTREALQSLGASLGADVAVQFSHRPQRGRDRGQLLEELSCGKKFYFLIIKPRTGCSTAAMYSAWDRQGKITLEPEALEQRQQALADALAKGDSLALSGYLYNDFQALLTGEARESFLAARESLLQAGALGVSLSGSGSALFGLFSGEKERDLAWEKLGRNLPEGWRLFACESLDSPDPEISVILAAGGSGRRFGDPRGKLMIPLKGKPVLQHSLECFYNHPGVAEIIIAHRPEDEADIRRLIGQLPPRSWGNPCEIRLTPGGEERQASVARALDLCSRERVLIHDGARPYVKEEAVDACLLGLSEYPGLSLGVPSRDTIKICNEKGEVLETTDRSRSWLVQTPQAFRTRFLREAHESIKEAVTDDCSLLEKAGCRVKLIPGDEANIKITFPADIP